ncbi:MAG: hypothetical protein JW817_00930 [Clostridiales bacterium]|nr:hypothetical protein [Clostridiales bacterium]
MHHETMRGIKDKFHAVRIRAAAAFLVVIMSFSLISCSDISGLIDRLTGGQSRLQENEPPIGKSNLVRLISSCLTDPSQIATVYSSVPNHQLDGMSIAEFEEYIGVLARLGDGKGALLSFQIMKDDSRLEICEALIEKLPSEEELLEISVPVMLEYDGVKEDDSTLIYFQQKENGTLYLSSEWARQCVEMYRFSELYFTSLQDQNADAVYSMLQNSYHDRDYSFSNSTIRLKAEEMCRFYLLRVKTDFREYRMASADITQIVFNQQGVLDDELLEYEPRTVTISRSDFGVIIVNDVLTDTLKVRDLYLYSGNTRTLRIGDHSNNAYFESLLGDPLLTTFSRIDPSGSIKTQATEPEYDLIVDYQTARINLRGTIDSSGAWEGVITRIQIGSTGPDFSIGRSIRVGMTLDDFMALYPFADETGFILITENDEQAYRLRIRLSRGAGDTVSGITLEAI